MSDRAATNRGPVGLSAEEQVLDAGLGMKLFQQKGVSA